MRYISLFSGIEAASVAWRDLDGFEPVAFCEIDKFPGAVLAHRFPDVPNLGDITKVNWKEVLEEHGAIDLVVGGSPCQSFSISAGANRSSLDGKSRLMFEYIRALAEIRPRWFLWENVPGVLNTRDNAFSQLLGEVQKLGYHSIGWRVLDAQFFGLAQRRRRVFLVGYLGAGGGAAAVLFDSESVCGNTCTSGEKRAQLANGNEERFAICLRTDHMTQNGRIDSCDVCQTLDVASGVPIVCMVNDAGKASVDVEISGTLLANSGTPPIISTSPPRYLTPVECERLQGFPDNWTQVPYNGKSADDCPNTPRYKALGNSMAVPVMQWIGKRIQAVDEILEKYRNSTRQDIMLALY